MITLYKNKKNTIYLEEGYLVDYVKQYFLDTPYKKLISKVELVDSFVSKDDSILLLITIKKAQSIDNETISSIQKELVYLLKLVFGLEKAKIAILLE